MANFLCISIRFLQPFFHGRADGDRPEWPPSPFRMFQALVAAAAAQSNERVRAEGAVPALRWLERAPPPLIVAAFAEPARRGHRIYFPDNVGDVLAAVWSRAGSADIAEYREKKDVRPMNLQGDAVHYVFPMDASDGEFARHKQIIVPAARSITHVGWGVDVVVADASVLTESEVLELRGERWLPAEGSVSPGLRVPVEGTLDDLSRRHADFLRRVEVHGQDRSFSATAVRPLSVFGVVGYRRATRPLQRQAGAFITLQPDATGKRAFHTCRHTRDIAGMVRHAIADAAARYGWTEERINVFVHGKTPDGARPASGEQCPDRFLYLPLPSINYALRRVESIRRFLVAAPAHCTEEVAWVRRALSGELLKNDNDEAVALATVLPRSDWVVRQYLDESRSWSTVTPVILSGYDDRNPDKAERLLKTAFAHAGYDRELIDSSEIEFRKVGFRAGVDLASRYVPPKNLDGRPRYHVRVRFPHPVPGPVVVGTGRFRGFGLFVRDDENKP